MDCPPTDELLGSELGCCDGNLNGVDFAAVPVGTCSPGVTVSSFGAFGLLAVSDCRELKGLADAWPAPVRDVPNVKGFDAVGKAGGGKNDEVAAANGLDGLDGGRLKGEAAAVANGLDAGVVANTGKVEADVTPVWKGEDPSSVVCFAAVEAKGFVGC